MVGNDIVDLGFFGSLTSQHVRHLSRVCTPAEVGAVMDSADPCKCLAVAWAAKEAAYKLLSKTEGNRSHFIPREFVLDVARLGKLNRRYQANVTRNGVVVRVEIEATERWVHAVTTFSGCKVVRWSVREINQSLLDQPRVESEAARLLAGELLTKCGEGDVALEFVGRVPIVSRKTGGQTGMGISLSHHGAFVAVAIAGPIAPFSVEREFSNLFVQKSSQGVMCSTSTA